MRKKRASSATIQGNKGMWKKHAEEVKNKYGEHVKRAPQRGRLTDAALFARAWKNTPRRSLQESCDGKKHARLGM